MTSLHSGEAVGDSDVLVEVLPTAVAEDRDEAQEDIALVCDLEEGDKSLYGRPSNRPDGAVMVTAVACRPDDSPDEVDKAPGHDQLSAPSSIGLLNTFAWVGDWYF